MTKIKIAMSGIYFAMFRILVHFLYTFISGLVAFQALDALDGRGLKGVLWSACLAAMTAALRALESAKALLNAADW